MAIRWDSESDWKDNQDSSGTTGRNGNLQQGYSRDRPPLSQDLVGYWPLHDKNATDYSGNDNHGTLNGGITTGVAGKGGLQAMSFDGGDDYISASIPGSQIKTISFWYKGSKVDNSLSYRMPVTDGSSGNKWIAFGEATGDISGETITVSIGQYKYTYTTDVIEADAWHHIVIRWNGSHYEFIIDGEFVEGQTTETHSELWQTDSIDIGARSIENNGYLEGSLFGIRLYKRALSDSEIQTLYEWGSKDLASPPTDGVSRYALDAASGSATTVDDVEDEDVSEYIEQTGNPVSGSGLVTQSNTVYEGSYAIKTNINDSTLLWTSTSGLPSYPSAGNTIRAQYRAAAQQSRGGIQFFTNSAGDQGYRLSFRYADNVTRLTELDTGTVLAETSSLPPADEWCEVEIQTESGGGTIGVVVRDSTGDQIIAIGGESKTQTSGGIGLYHSSANTDNTFYWDSIETYTNEGTTDSWGTNDATSNGGLVYSSDAIRGQAASFDGIDDYLNLGNIKPSAITVSLWVKASAQDNDGIISKRDGTNAASWTLRTENDSPTNDGVRLFVRDTSGSRVADLFVPDVLNDTWAHIVFTYSASEGAKIYVNSRQEDSAGATGNELRQTDSVIEIGHYKGGVNSDKLSGNVDDVRIYDRVLSPSEVHELYRWGTRGRDLRKFLVTQ